MSDERKPRDGEYWVVTIQGRLPPGLTPGREVVRICGSRMVFSCGDDEAWRVDHDGVTFIRKVEL